MTAPESSESFRFVTHITLTELTGRKARDLPELLENLRTVPPSVIYFHTHHFLEQHHFLSPEPPNDFAYWVTNALNEPELGERLAAIDTIQFHTISSLREALISTVDKHLVATSRHRSTTEGEALHFMSSRSIVIPTSYTANS